MRTFSGIAPAAEEINGASQPGCRVSIAATQIGESPAWRQREWRLQPPGASLWNINGAVGRLPLISLRGGYFSSLYPSSSPRDTYPEGLPWSDFGASWIGPGAGAAGVDAAAALLKHD